MTTTIQKTIKVATGSKALLGNPFVGDRKASSKPIASGFGWFIKAKKPTRHFLSLREKWGWLRLVITGEFAVAQK